MPKEYLDIGDADGCVIGKAATNLVAFYGAAPVVQRSSSLQATAACAASVISVSTALGAWAGEVRATLVGLGLWAGA
jgi:hypothetical protein